jgi:hypothetical protein
MAAQEVEQLTPGLRFCCSVKKCVPPGTMKVSTSLPWLFSASAIAMHLRDRHVLVAIAMDQQHRCVDLRHPQDRRAHRQPSGPQRSSR